MSRYSLDLGSERTFSTGLFCLLNVVCRLLSFSMMPLSLFHKTRKTSSGHKIYICAFTTLTRVVFSLTHLETSLCNHVFLYTHPTTVRVGSGFHQEIMVEIQTSILCEPCLYAVLLPLLGPLPHAAPCDTVCARIGLPGDAYDALESGKYV